MAPHHAVHGLLRTRPQALIHRQQLRLHIQTYNHFRPSPALFSTTPTPLADNPPTSPSDAEPNPNAPAPLDLDSLIDDRLDFIKRRPGISLDRPRPARTQKTRPSSVAALLAKFRAEDAQPRPARGDGTLNLDLMDLPASPAKRAGVPGLDARPTVPETVRPPFRIDPTLGRSVTVDPGKRMDLGRAFRSLEVKCSVNSVKQDFNKQRFHERPGLKRKRLLVQRWRKRFKDNFSAVVRRVREMQGKGW